jgi:glutathione peroxidase
MKFLLLAAALGSLIPTLRAAAPYDIPLKTIDGDAATLDQYRGKVLLIVNVASACGYTPQYEGLQALHAKQSAAGLVVLGFPCNQFGAQESGSNAEIKEFCSTKFHVTFPMFEKIEVNGAKRHPLYTYLTGKESPFPGNIKWNFSKFLVGRDGKILARFGSDVEPDSPDLLKAIESALAKK